MGYAKSAETQRRLVQTTARLLRTRGYAATGLSAVVQDSGVPKGSLYHHFPGGKEELAAASVRFSGEGICASLSALAERAGDPVDAVRAFCDHYIEQLEASAFRRGCPLATVALDAAADVDVVHDACADAFGAIIDLLATRLSERGAAAPAARAAAVFTVAAVEGALLLAKARRDTAPIKVVRDQLDAHLRALTAVEGEVTEAVADAGADAVKEVSDE